ncbi:hypothetical protein T484DRAFT_1861070 [Baffinella frigidus]|nr:hypothetical protein T484DRAFT_1861070 [Cryptophyta sp. CCMP2293]
MAVGGVPESAEFRSRIDGLNAKALEMFTNKAAEDKAEIEMFTNKAAEDKAKIHRLATRALQYKTDIDRLTTDGVELEMLNTKAVSDKAEIGVLTAKAATDRSELHRLTTKAVTDKAEFYRLSSKVAEEQIEIDRLNNKVAVGKVEISRLTAKAAEDKAEADQILAKAAEDKVEISRLTTKAVEDKAEAGQLMAKAAEDKAEAGQLMAKAVEDKAEAGQLMAKAAEDKAEAVQLMAKAMPCLEGFQDELAELRETHTVDLSALKAARVKELNGLKQRRDVKLTEMQAKGFAALVAQEKVQENALSDLRETHKGDLDKFKAATVAAQDKAQAKILKDQEKALSDLREIHMEDLDKFENKLGVVTAKAKDAKKNLRLITLKAGEHQARFDRDAATIAELQNRSSLPAELQRGARMAKTDGQTEAQKRQKKKRQKMARRERDAVAAAAATAAAEAATQSEISAYAAAPPSEISRVLHENAESLLGSELAAVAAVAVAGMQQGSSDERLSQAAAKKPRSGEDSSGEESEEFRAMLVRMEEPRSGARTTAQGDGGSEEEGGSEDEGAEGGSEVGGGSAHGSDAQPEHEGAEGGSEVGGGSAHGSDAQPEHEGEEGGSEVGGGSAHGARGGRLDSDRELLYRNGGRESPAEKSFSASFCQEYFDSTGLHLPPAEEGGPVYTRDGDSDAQPPVLSFPGFLAAPFLPTYPSYHPVSDVSGGAPGATETSSILGSTEPLSPSSAAQTSSDKRPASTESRPTKDSSAKSKAAESSTATSRQEAPGGSTAKATAIFPSGWVGGPSGVGSSKGVGLGHNPSRVVTKPVAKSATETEPGSDFDGVGGVASPRFDTGGGHSDGCTGGDSISDSDSALPYPHDSCHTPGAEKVRQEALESAKGKASSDDITAGGAAKSKVASDGAARKPLRPVPAAIKASQKKRTRSAVSGGAVENTSSSKKRTRSDMEVGDALSGLGKRRADDSRAAIMIPGESDGADVVHTQPLQTPPSFPLD